MSMSRVLSPSNEVVVILLWDIVPVQNICNRERGDWKSHRFVHVVILSTRARNNVEKEMIAVLE